MALGKRFAELTGLNITDIIHNVVEAVAERTAYSLEDSQHAPMKGNRDIHPGVCQVSSLLSLSGDYLLNSPLSLTQAVLKPKQTRLTAEHNLSADSRQRK